MAKPTYSPIPTKSELGRMEVGGAKPKPQAHVTITQVQQILNNHVNNRPDADDMAKPEVVDIVKKWVNKNNDNNVTGSGVTIREKSSGTTISFFQDKKSGQWFARQR